MLTRLRLASLLTLLFTIPSHGLIAAGVDLSITTATATLPSGWTMDVAESNTITLKEGVIELHAAESSFAHIEHPLQGTGSFRASCSINSPATARWAPSLFLYWGPHNWVQMGYIAGHDMYHVNGPGLYGVVMEEGKRVENRLTTTSSNDWRPNEDHGGLDMVPPESLWHEVAVAVGPDAFYFQTRRDNEWDTLLILPRTGEMQQPPKMLVVGKGMSDPKDHPAPDLDNSDNKPGRMVLSRIRNVQVESVSDPLLKASEVPQEHFRDVIGQQEIDRPGDPTFDSVASHWPAMKYSREVIGVKDHADEFAVFPNGAIGYDAANWFWFTIGQKHDRFGVPTLPAKRLENKWMPVVTSSWEYEGLKFEQTAFGWSENMSPDQPFQAYFRMNISNAGSATTTTRLGLYDNRKKGETKAWKNIEVPAAGTTSVWFKGGSAKKEPFAPVDVKAEEFDSRLKEVSSWWAKEMDRGMQIDIPEPRIMDAWKAWLAYTYINVDKIDGRYELHDGGAGFYELVYAFSAARAALVFDQLGRHDDARRYLEAMTKMGNADGLFIINFGLPDQGALMNGLCFHYNITHDKEWLRTMAPTLIKMSEWIKKERAKQKKTQDPAAPFYGMIHGRPYCDHPDPGYYFVSDMLMATGLDAVAMALREIGSDKDAAWIAEEAAAYKTDLRQVLTRSVFTMEGAKLLALFPETRELLRATRWMTSNYYSLCVTSLLEDGADLIPQDSEYTKIIVDSLEHRGGFLMGMGRFWGGIDHAYTAGYWYHKLLVGEPEKALLGLYGSLAYGMTRDTFSAVEVTFGKTGMNFPTLPHSYSNLQQLRLVRNLLLLEQGTTLTLGAGIARHWLEDGKHVGVDRAVTDFGEVSYRMEPVQGGEGMRVSITPPTKTLPAALRVWVRNPAERKIKGVTSDGRPVANVTLADEWFEMPCPDKPVVLEIALRKP